MGIEQRPVFYVAVPVLGGGVLIHGPLPPDLSSDMFVRETASGNEPARFGAHHIGAAMLRGANITLGEEPDAE